jgi:hypothetical protein
MIDIVSYGFWARARRYHPRRHEFEEIASNHLLRLLAVERRIGVIDVAQKYEEGANDETGLPVNVERFRGRASRPTAWNIRGQDISQDLFLDRRKSSH